MHFWSFHLSIMFSVSSMYIRGSILMFFLWIGSCKSIKFSSRSNCLSGLCTKGLFLLKITWLKGTDMKILKMCAFCSHDETVKHLFFDCQFAHSNWSTIKVVSTLIRQKMSQTFLTVSWMVHVVTLELRFQWDARSLWVDLAIFNKWQFHFLVQVICHCTCTSTILARWFNERRTCQLF